MLSVATVWVDTRKIWDKSQPRNHLEDQLQRPLHYAIADAGNLKRPDFAAALRDVHPSVLLGLVSAR